jgi:hypothetical protein
MIPYPRAIGAAVLILAAAGLAHAMMPRQMMVRGSEKFDLQEIVPREYGEWSEVPGACGPGRSKSASKLAVLPGIRPRLPRSRWPRRDANGCLRSEPERPFATAPSRSLLSLRGLSGVADNGDPVAVGGWVIATQALQIDRSAPTAVRTNQLLDAGRR